MPFIVQFLHIFGDFHIVFNNVLLDVLSDRLEILLDSYHLCDEKLSKVFNFVNGLAMVGQAF